MWPELLGHAIGQMGGRKFEVWGYQDRYWWRDLVTDELIPVPPSAAERYRGRYVK